MYAHLYKFFFHGDVEYSSLVRTCSYCYVARISRLLLSTIVLLNSLLAVFTTVSRLTCGPLDVYLLN